MGVSSSRRKNGAFAGLAGQGEDSRCPPEVVFDNLAHEMGARPGVATIESERELLAVQGAPIRAR